MWACRCLFRRFSQNIGRTQFVDLSLERDQLNQDMDLGLDFGFWNSPFSHYRKDAHRLCSSKEAMKRISASYVPHVYAYGLLEGSEIIESAVERNIVDPSINSKRFMVHPRALICHPSKFSTYFGPSRSPAFIELLEELLTQYDMTKDSVVKKCCSLGADIEKWVPFLRGLCLCVVAGDPIASQAGFVIEDSLHRNTKEVLLPISGDYNQRGILTADMLMAASVEFCLLSVAIQSVSLYLQFVPEIPLFVSKRIALCFTRSERQSLEWSFRCTESDCWQC
ncbi:hypothetical protein TRVL_05151 [Trypanosoma vivax]|uniref:Uncharacterized protein n=1 Tax=Trypanosoma vivax (strain Y486) TaxID=1055687 RepID=G0U9E0_TRYVY|nr:hypothetical protein TRVL_05151 [Trypanosoma vivax]CCC54225.1 conserved hypothetical protein [Trypanosoma vivax Y486]